MSDIDWPQIHWTNPRRMAPVEGFVTWTAEHKSPSHVLKIVIAPVLPCSDRIAEARALLATQLDEVGDALGARVIRALSDGVSR